MEMNVFFEGVDSLHQFQQKMFEQIEKQVEIDRIVMTFKTHDNQDVYDENKVRLINYDMCEHNRYEEFYDFDDFEPLSRELLTKMKPYESTAIQMLVRNFERDIYTYDECRRFYLNHLRFWNHVLKTEKIGLICFNNIPHHCHDYVIYALAEVLEIPRCLCMDTTITGRLAIADSLDNAWVRTKELYEEYRKKDEVVLPDDLERYYQALLYDSTKKDAGAVHRGMTRKDHIALRRKAFTFYCSPAQVGKRMFSRVKHGLKVTLQQKNKAGIKEGISFAALEWKYNRRAKMKLSMMKGTDYYNTLTKEPDETRPFITFFLHLQPEATTLPQGDVFVEQELMIQILATAAEQLGIGVCVKEHFVQPYRNKYFYDRLYKMRNVTLIHTDADSKQLARKSLATASCNGTILNESIYNGKPTIIFGNTVFQAAPGVFKVSDVDSALNALKEILAGTVEINQHDVRAYLAAFGQNSLLAYFDVALYEKNGQVTEEEGCKAFADYYAGVIRKIKRGV